MSFSTFFIGVPGIIPCDKLKIKGLLENLFKIFVISMSNFFFPLNKISGFNS